MTNSIHRILDNINPIRLNKLLLRRLLIIAQILLLILDKWKKASPTKPIETAGISHILIGMIISPRKVLNCSIIGASVDLAIFSLHLAGVQTNIFTTEGSLK
jgi:hypothetical protein